jgi:hypothetical protein
MTLISSVQTTLLGGRYGSLILMLAPHKSGLELNRLVKISTTTGFRSNLTVISYGECRYPHLLSLQNIIIISSALKTAALTSIGWHE